MVKYVYCGSVDLTTEEVPAFEKVLESLKIDFERSTQEEATEDKGNEQNDDDSYVDDKEFESMIDVDEPEWADLKIKEEPEDKNEVTLSEATRAQPVDDDSDLSSAESQTQQPFEHRYAQSMPRFKIIRPPKHTIIRQPQDIFTKSPIPISVDRVVPSRAIQKFMLKYPEVCPFCEKSCKTNKHRNEHVKYCFSNPNRIVSVCPLCDKSVCDPYYLRKHLRNVHRTDQT